MFLKTQDLPSKFGSGKQYENVAPHAQGPLNFPHSEITAKAVLENRHLVRSGADVSATVRATVVAFYRVTVKHLNTSRWNAASSNCSDFPQAEFRPGIFAGSHLLRNQSGSLPASRLLVLIRTMPNWITSESPTDVPARRTHLDTLSKGITLVLNRTRVLARQ